MIDVPADALLRTYADRADCFTDCYMIELDHPVEFGTYLCAFYSTWVFAPEMVILKVALGRPARGYDVLPLALGDATRFAAWDVEARAKDEVLLVDVGGHTRSWLKVEGRRIYFGSAVVPPQRDAELGFIFKALLGFHKVYSRALIGAAARKLRGMVG